MPRRIHSQPKICRHRRSDRAYVWLDGRQVYLGPWGSPEAKAEYRRVIACWQTQGRPTPGRSLADLTVAELCLCFLQEAEKIYSSSEMAPLRTTIRVLRELFATRMVAEFGPLCLESYQLILIERDYCRRTINSLVNRVRLIFKWGVRKELVSPAVWQALLAVPGLRKGRGARESQPRLPVADDVFEATLPLLPPVTIATILDPRSHAECEARVFHRMDFGELTKKRTLKFARQLSQSLRGVTSVKESTNVAGI